MSWEDDHPYPLDVLVIGMHAHSPGGRTRRVLSFLERSNDVRAYGSVQYFSPAMELIEEGKVNTVFIDPPAVMFSDSSLRVLQAPATFIREIRQRFPSIVFALYGSEYAIAHWVSENPTFAHYFMALEPAIAAFPQYGAAQIRDVRPGNAIEHESLPVQGHFDLDEESFSGLLKKCQDWHSARSDFDVTLSFAGENRPLARELASELSKFGARIFFDEYFSARIPW